MEGIGTLGAAGLLGIIGQLWRANGKLPNWGLYVVLLVAAAIGQIVWGTDAAIGRDFWQHVLESWMVSLGMNRITSDAVSRTPLATRRESVPPLKEN
jgi:hypothetical protein